MLIECDLVVIDSCFFYPLYSHYQSSKQEMVNLMFKETGEEQTSLEITD